MHEGEIVQHCFTDPIHVNEVKLTFVASGGKKANIVSFEVKHLPSS